MPINFADSKFVLIIAILIFIKKTIETIYLSKKDKVKKHIFPLFYLHIFIKVYKRRVAIEPHMKIYFTVNS